MTIPLCPAFNPSSLRAGWVEGRVWREVDGNAYTLHARIVQNTPSFVLGVPPSLELDPDLGLIVEWTTWIPLRELTRGLQITIRGKSAATINIDGDLVLGITKNEARSLEERSLALPMCAGWHRVIVDNALVGRSSIEIAAIGADGRCRALTPHMAPRSLGRIASTQWPGHGSFTPFEVESTSYSASTLIARSTAF